MGRFKSFVIVLLALGVTRAAAQGDCPAIVEQALSAVDAFCQGAGRNQACYGNLSLQAEPQPGVEGFRFKQVGDIVDVADLQSMRLSPMDVETGSWGVALLRLQANLPETLPGQNVTFLLFGDVEIENATPPGDPTQTPMQAFYLHTGIGDAGCEDAPESGLLVQTPEGVGEVAFTVNGVDVAMGSTVFFQSGGESDLNVATVEGAAYTRRGGDRRVILAGTQTRFTLQDVLNTPSGLGLAPPLGTGSKTPPPVLGQPYDADQFRALPLRLLQRRIEIHPPLTRFQLARARDLLASGRAPCGEDPFPACEKLPLAVGGRPCVLLEAQGTPAPNETRLPCPTPERPLLGGRRPCPAGRVCPTATPSPGG